MDGLQNIPAPSSAGASESSNSQNSVAPSGESPNSQKLSAKGGGGAASPQANRSASSSTSKAQPEPTQSKSDPEVFEVKVNGRTVKMTRQEALDHASMAYRASEKFNEAAQYKKQHEEWQTKVKQNTIEALQEAGLTKDQIRDYFESWYAKEYIEPETLSPEQRELKEYKSKLAQYEQQEKARTQKEAEAQEVELTKKELAYYQEQILDALKNSKLPQKNKQIVSRIAYYMDRNIREGWDAPMDMIVRQVQNERQEQFRPELEEMPVDEFLNLYGDAGEKFIQRLRQFDLQRLRDSRSQKSQGFNPGKSFEAPQTNNERLSMADVDKRMRDIRSGKITW